MKIENLVMFGSFLTINLNNNNNITKCKTCENVITKFCVAMVNISHI